MPHIRPHSRTPAALSTSPPAATGRFRAPGSDPDIALVAVVVTLIGEEPSVRLLHGPADRLRLPTAPYRLDAGLSLDQALRDAVSSSIGLELGHLEQLDCSALLGAASMSSRLSIGYLALAHLNQDVTTANAHGWKSWYAFFPWEDWRRGRPSILGELIEPRLRQWAETQLGSEAGAGNEGGLSRLERVRMVFGLDGIGWDEERVVERLDLLEQVGVMTDLAKDLQPDHRRTLAVAISRLRSRIKSRPVIFDLMPERFTLFELQRTVEAILGPHLHKQNFRRLVEHMGLVEPTDEIKSHTGGRPAKLFRFRQSVLHERLQPGVRVRMARG
jgi:hypothetical protein